jgi:hypothetical protein
LQPFSSPALLSSRTAGVLYLAVIALGLFGEAFVRGSIVAGADPAATAANLLGAESLWRLHVATDLLMHVLDVPLIVFLYLLLRPVSHALALLATGFNVVQTCVLAGNKLTLVAALAVLEPGVFPAGSYEGPALASLAVDLHGHGFGIGLVFFGLACLVRGWLAYRSGYVPRALGVLLALAGASYLVNSFALLLSPAVASALFPAVLLPAFVGELGLALWLVFTDPRVLQQTLAGASAATARTRVAPGT